MSIDWSHAPTPVFFAPRFQGMLDTRATVAISRNENPALILVFFAPLSFFQKKAEKNSFFTPISPAFFSLVFPVCCS